MNNFNLLYKQLISESSEFRIGDRVRITNIRDSCDADDTWCIGQTGTIKNIWKTIIQIIPDNPAVRPDWFESELELEILHKLANRDDISTARDLLDI